jgi:hypothetical protein
VIRSSSGIVAQPPSSKADRAAATAASASSVVTAGSRAMTSPVAQFTMSTSSDDPALRHCPPMKCSFACEMSSVGASSATAVLSSSLKSRREDLPRNERKSISSTMSTIMLTDISARIMSE